MKPPKDLKKDGKKLWTWIVEQFDGQIEDALPLVEELCRIADRLAGLRAEIAQTGHYLPGKVTAKGVQLPGTKNPVIDQELKAAAAFNQTWKLLGLADKPESPRSPGRPPNSER